MEIVDAVRRLLAGHKRTTRPGYDNGTASFTLDRQTFEYLKRDPWHSPQDAKSWEYGKYPKVLAALPLADGGRVTVFAVAERWNTSHILVSWADDGRHVHWAWIPAGNVERVSDSDWDIWEYHRYPENLRGVRWSGAHASHTASASVASTTRKPVTTAPVICSNVSP